MILYFFLHEHVTLKWVSSISARIAYASENNLRLINPGSNMLKSIFLKYSKNKFHEYNNIKRKKMHIEIYRAAK